MIIGVAAIFAVEFQDATTASMEPAPGSRVGKAFSIFEANFPTLASMFSDAFLIQCESCHNIGYDQAAEDLFNKWRNESTLSYPGAFTSWRSFWDVDTRVRPWVQDAFISEDRMTTIVQFTTDQSLSDNTRFRLEVDLRSSIDALNESTPGYYIGITGLDLALLDCRTSTFSAMMRNDIIVLPIALFILIWAIGSWRMLPVTIFCFSASLCISLASLVWISEVFDKVLMIVPSVMQGLTIAMNIDYSLFLFSRYIEERKTKSHVKAVDEALRKAGHIVLLSGITLALTFLGFTAFPISFVYTMGIGCAITLISTLLVNLTFIPVCLLLFPNYFSVIQFLPFCTKRANLEKVMVYGKEKPKVYSISTHLLAGEPEEPGLVEVDLGEKYINHNCWYAVTSVLLTNKFTALAVIIIIFGVTIPLAYFFIYFHVSQSVWEVLPSSAKSVEVFDFLQINFPGGSIMPFYIIVDQENCNATSIFNQPYFDVLYNLTDKVLNYEDLNLKGSTVSSLQSLSRNGETIMNLTAASALSMNTSVQYNYLYSNFISENRIGSVIMIVTPFDPNLMEGRKFAHFLWDTIDEVNTYIDSSKYGIYAAGTVVGVTDVVDTTMDSFPIVFAAATAMIFILLAAAFRSIFVIFRYIFTLLVPIGFVLGWSVLVCQKGILNWTSISQLEASDEKAVYWFVPTLTIPICIGLALDYDIFIFSRIMERREEGHSMKEAILHGVAETGGTISTAGVIMAIAFGGLLFTTIRALNQVSIMFVASVLLDTFVVRTMLVPCFLYVFGDLNWWPTKRPRNRDITGGFDPAPGVNTSPVKMIQ